MWYNYTAMGGSKRKNKLPPSYTGGALRDKTIEAKQDVNFQPEDLLRLVAKVVRVKGRREAP